MGSASMQRISSAGDAGAADRAGSRAATASATSSSCAWALSRLQKLMQVKGRRGGGGSLGFRLNKVAKALEVDQTKQEKRTLHAATMRCNHCLNKHQRRVNGVIQCRPRRRTVTEKQNLVKRSPSLCAELQ
jgi:hypothetical protein